LFAAFLLMPESNFIQFIIREIDELRRRLVWCLGSLGLVSAVLMGAPHWEDSYAIRLSNWLRIQLLPPGAHLVFLSPLEPMAQIFKLALCVAFVVCVPVLAYHFLAFTRPALAEGMRGFYVRFMVLAMAFFGVGLVFSGCFLAPMTFSMLIHYGVQAGGEAQITFERFYSFITLFLLAFSAPFEIPLIMAFLHRFNLVPADWFRAHRRQAYGVFLLLSQFVTPDPLVTPLIFTAMGIFLFELGILMANWL
jgi:sec-independent protein translocase protein TatC